MAMMKSSARPVSMMLLMIIFTYAALSVSSVRSCNSSWMIYEKSAGNAFLTFERVYLLETSRHTLTN